MLRYNNDHDRNATTLKVDACLREVDLSKKLNIMFDAKKYIETTKKVPVNSLIITHAYTGLMLKELNEKQFMAVVKEVELQTAIEESNDYLFTVQERTTPELIKQAKKSLKGYMEYLIFRDLTGGLFGPEMASKAKTALPRFLKQNKTIENEG